jgi:hypothetical protein
VDLAYRYGVALNAREVPDDLLAPGFFMVNAETAVTDKTYYGAAGVIEWIRDLFEVWDASARFEIFRVVADGEEPRATQVSTGVSGRCPHSDHEP